MKGHSSYALALTKFYSQYKVFFSYYLNQISYYILRYPQLDILAVCSSHHIADFLVQVKLIQPEVVSCVSIRIHRPRDSLSLGLSQICILGYPGLCEPGSVPQKNNTRYLGQVIWCQFSLNRLRLSDVYITWQTN